MLFNKLQVFLEFNKYAKVQGEHDLYQYLTWESEINVGSAQKDTFKKDTGWIKRFQRNSD
jgi:hypothetical protein